MTKVIKGIQIPQRADFVGSFLRPSDLSSSNAQCGFASCAIGNKLTPEEQWAKLRLVREIVEEVW